MPSGEHMCTVLMGIHLGAELPGQQICTYLLALDKFLMSWQHSERERVSIKIRVTALPSKCKDPTICDPHSTFVTDVLVPPQSPPNLPHVISLGFWRPLDFGLQMSVLWACAEPDQLWKAVPNCQEASCKRETSRSFHHGEDC